MVHLILDSSMRRVVFRAAVMSGVAFFGALTGISIAGIVAQPSQALLAAAIASGTAFFGALASSLENAEKKPPETDAP